MLRSLVRWSITYDFYPGLATIIENKDARGTASTAPRGNN
jgi:hypothetical protein